MAAAFSEHVEESNASGAFVGTSLAVAGLGGPIIHFAHGRWQSGLGSIGLRVGGAFVGALLGAAIASTGRSNPDADVPEGLVGGLLGFGVGAVTGALVDDFVLAWERVPVKQTGSTPSSDGDVAVAKTAGGGLHLSLAPIAGPKQTGMAVVGRF
jgi:hypothetical protein